MLSRRLPFVALLALVACATKEARRPDTTSPASATLAGTPSSDAATVRQAIEFSNAQYSAATLKGDSTAISGIYTDSAVLMFSNMPAARGHEAIAKAYGGMVRSMKVSALKLTTQDVIVSGDYAIETGAYDMTSQETAKGSKSQHEVGKYLVVWKKQLDGSYKILRESANSDMPMK